MKIFYTLYPLLLLFPESAISQVVERFPKPDFQSGYMRPVLQVLDPRSIFLEYLDIFVLVAALSLASYFALKLRSRSKIFILMILNLAYFGFFRKGCVCPVGSVQNVSLALFDKGYVIPLSVIIFFALPLVFTLFFGRTFCAAVCPLGAIQDTVVLKPVKIKPWLSQVLGVLPYLYLGFAVLFAATGAGFIICQYDPFVGFFRFGASSAMIFLGVSILLLGTVVARPYCRFLCPYGVILGWMSNLSKWHVSISPAECNNCRLCEESCPMGAINKPTGDITHDRGKSIRNLALLLVLLPVITIAGGWTVSHLDVPLSRMHFTVSLAEKIERENSGILTTLSDETKAFRASERTTEELFSEAGEIRSRFRTGGWILGMFLGFILGFKLIGLSVFRHRTEYSIDTANCTSCGRCFSYCPLEKDRLAKKAHPGSLR